LGAALTIGKEYSAVRMELQDQSLIYGLAHRDESAFEQVFKTHFKSLHAYAFSIIKDAEEAEEAVQKVFFKIWDRSDKLHITGSVAAYLYRAVHNECLNYLKHLKVRAHHQMHVAYSMKNRNALYQESAPSRELEKEIRDALNDLPEQCRTVFQLSRFESLKYWEIADRLGISVKTVENQMGKALRILRVRLVDFLPVLILLVNLKYL